MHPGQEGSASERDPESRVQISALTLINCGTLGRELGPLPGLQTPTLPCPRLQQHRPTTSSARFPSGTLSICPEVGSQEIRTPDYSEDQTWPSAQLRAQVPYPHN